MRRLLISGASGFVGRHCLQPALDLGFEVHAVSSRLVDDVQVKQPDIHWHHSNLLDAPSVIALLRDVRPSHFLHMAWETTHGSYWTSPANQSWLEMGSVLAKAFSDHGGQRFISAGTCAEYAWSEGLMIEDFTPSEPATYYGQTKLAHHYKLMADAEQLGFGAATGRIFFGYGPFENGKRLIPYLCQSLLHGETAKIANGELRRDFMHVFDLGAAFLALLCSDLTGIVNVASGAASALAEIAGQLGHIAGRPELLTFGRSAAESGEPQQILGESNKLKSTGWQPQIQLAEGLAKTYAWWTRHLKAV